MPAQLALPSSEWWTRVGNNYVLTMDTVPRRTRLRRWLHLQRLWIRYRFVHDAPYPPRVSTEQREKYSWWADLKAALKNPPRPHPRHLL